ncbi:MAG: histidine kinase, partial [Nitratireductor sp.]|nr:histidine kinase [Nitratireductor sp.]
MRQGTLSRRLILLTSLWAVLSIGLVAFLLSQAYRVNAERRFEELVTANLYNLMGAVEPGADGRLAGQPDLRDPRFLSFGSGWYWVVNSVSDPSNRLASASLADGDIIPPADLPFDDRFQRSWAYVDSRGQELTAVEARVFLGSGSEVYSFRATGNKGEITEEITSFTRTMVLLLAIFGLGFVLASFVIVRIGLAPITGATRSLGAIREGRAQRLEGSFPREIQPLIDETNALIESNRAV